MNILLTNDDGIYAVGLRALYTAFTEAGHTVYAVAPLTEQSAVSNSLTVFNALRTKEIVDSTFNGLGVHGTPADCVKLALGALLPQRPDMVISGINNGPNVGPDIRYSGTVAAACEAAHMGIRAVALSYDDYRPTDLLAEARHAVGLVDTLPWSCVPTRSVVNVNYPSRPLSQSLGVRVCRQTKALWDDAYDERLDPRGSKYWWLHGQMRTQDVEPESDRGLLTEGYITVTPLRFEYTHEECLVHMEKALKAPA